MKNIKRSVWHTLATVDSCFALLELVSKLSKSDIKLFLSMCI